MVLEQNRYATWPISTPPNLPYLDLILNLKEPFRIEIIVGDGLSERRGKGGVFNVEKQDFAP